MKYSEGNIGRVFVLRLEDGDKMPDIIEDFAKNKAITGAACWYVGGMHDGSVVVGPKDSNAMPPKPMLHNLDGVHEAAAVGTIFEDEEGNPKLHMHAALGREGKTRTGCIRPGVHTWVIGEVVIIEVINSAMIRKTDPDTGFSLLECVRHSQG